MRDGCKFEDNLTNFGKANDGNSYLQFGVYYCSLASNRMEYEHLINEIVSFNIFPVSLHWINI